MPSFIRFIFLHILLVSLFLHNCITSTTIAVILWFCFKGFYRNVQPCLLNVNFSQIIYALKEMQCISTDLKELLNKFRLNSTHVHLCSCCSSENFTRRSSLFISFIFIYLYHLYYKLLFFSFMLLIMFIFICFFICHV